jgi:hypothetical protein
VTLKRKPMHYSGELFQIPYNLEWNARANHHIELPSILKVSKHCTMTVRYTICSGMPKFSRPTA